MRPNIHLNGLAIVVSVVACFLLGGLWYGAIFGKAWRNAMGFTGDAKPSGAEFARGALINIIGLFLMSFVMSHQVLVWRPSVWNVGTDAAPHYYSFFAGLFLWAGFVVPMLLNGVGYERRSWKAFFITAGYHLVSLQLMAMILSYWRA
jgi:hypothetical protein